MKRSEYARHVGVTDNTADQWWKARQLAASQLPTGTSSVREPTHAATGVARSARVCSAEQRDDVTRQMQRVRDDAASRGSQVVAEVSEIASSLHEERPKRKQLLTDARVGVLVVEHTDRLTRVGYGSRMPRFEPHARR